ncbi:DNA-J related domain-containing protein [Marinimicrobium locisalis]|uniref:DNA-J related domain-containing protein n=1 Tax=Marinimicrobium locisalis TaxID=546022 RepID=UPI00322186E2
MSDKSSHWPEQAERNPLLAPVQSLLERAGETPQSEFTLIKGLKAQGLVARDYSFHPLSLFRVHFQVFNALYRLQPVMAEQGWALVISPLATYRRPLREGESAQALAEEGDSALRDFYLDWSQYDAATEDTVVELLAGFWRRMERGRAPDAQERADALAELDLEDPVAPEQIKRRYRRLAMDHHPDRGGSQARLQRINAAMAILERGQ